MFIKKEIKTNKKGTRTYIRIVESYRDGGISKQRAIKNYGYLEDQEDPKEFMKMVESELKELDKHKGNDITIKINSKDNLLNGPNNIAYHYGYRYLESVYDYLKIDNFLNNYQKSLDGKHEYKISNIFKFLVLERILEPASKRKSLTGARYYYGKNFNFSLDDVYRSLDLIAQTSEELQTHIRTRINNLTNIKVENLYYDVTNYYCEIDLNDLADGLRKKGVSKEHRTTPIIGMGLFMDDNGLPISFKLFPGNTADSVTLIPSINEVKKENNLERVICVADKGMNSLKNISFLVNNGDGYLFSQMVRGKKGKKYGDEIFKGDFIEKMDNNGEVIYKYKTYLEQVTLIDEEGNKYPKDQKVLLFYSKEHADREKRKRDEQLEKVRSSLKNGAYNLDHSFRKYLLKEGESKAVGIDYTKVYEDEKYDGYFCLITSETHMDHNQIKELYSNLWEIEETFKVTKTNLEFRPIHLSKKEHIIAHFLICFTALVILRLLQHKLKSIGVRLSPERIITVLNRMKVEKTVNDIYHLHSISGSTAYKELIKKGKTIYTNCLTEEDQIERDFKLLNVAFGIEMDKAYVKVEEFNRYLRKIKFI